MGSALVIRAQEPTNYAFKHLLLFGETFGLLDTKDCKGAIEPYVRPDDEAQGVRPCVPVP